MEFLDGISMFQESLTKSLLQSLLYTSRKITTFTDRGVRGAGAADGDIDVAKPGMAEQLAATWWISWVWQHLLTLRVAEILIFWKIPWCFCLDFFHLMALWCKEMYFKKCTRLKSWIMKRWKCETSATAAWEVLKCCWLWQRHGAVYWRAGGGGVGAGPRHCWVSQEERSLRCREDRKLSCW